MPPIPYLVHENARRPLWKPLLMVGIEMQHKRSSSQETLEGAFVKAYHLPGSPDIETKRVGQLTAACGTDAPNSPPFRGGGSVNHDHPGLGSRSIFYPSIAQKVTPSHIG